MTDSLKRNANVVEALGSALREGDHAIGTVPGLVKRVLAEGSWREFVTRRGDHVQHERFADFVVAQPLRGIGASVDLVRRVISADTEALDLLDRELQNPVGSNQHTMPRDNDTRHVDPNRRGTSKAYSLRKLRKDAPDLHAEVIAGSLSAHAAMVQAGFTPKTFTIRTNSADSVVRALQKNLAADVLAEVIDKLTR